jgi:hypothetical protein
LGVGLTTLPCEKKIVKKPPRNSAGFCGGGHGLSWAVQPRREEEEEDLLTRRVTVSFSRRTLFHGVSLKNPIFHPVI